MKTIDGALMLVLLFAASTLGPLPQTACAAQPKPSTAQKKGPCEDDWKKFCGGDNHKIGCMFENVAMLSASCQPLIRSKMEVTDQIKSGCTKDDRALCPGAQHSADALPCWRKQKDKFSPDCSAAFSRLDKIEAAMGPPSSQKSARPKRGMPKKPAPAASQDQANP